MAQGSLFCNFDIKTYENYKRPKKAFCWKFSQKNVAIYDQSQFEFRLEVDGKHDKSQYFVFWIILLFATQNFYTSI